MVRRCIRRRLCRRLCRSTTPWSLASALLVASLATVFVNVLRHPSSPALSPGRPRDGTKGTMRTDEVGFLPVLPQGRPLRKHRTTAADTGSSKDTDRDHVLALPQGDDVESFLAAHRRDLRRSNVTEPWPSLTTYCHGRRGLIAGFRNQVMALSVLVFHANHAGHGQLLLDSLLHKDTYGTDLFVPFEFYFDVDHWNTHYNETEVKRAAAASASNDTHQRQQHPWSLPRLVHHDPNLHDQWDPLRGSYIDAVLNGSQVAVTRPYGYPKGSTRLAASYQHYVKGKGKFANTPVPENSSPPPPNSTTTNDNDNIDIVRNRRPSRRNPAEILMLRGALRPNPALQAVLDGLLLPVPYMTIHARVEPDMQRHPVCRDKKVLRLSEVIEMIEERFPTPPRNIRAVFLPINRQYLEREGTVVGVDLAISTAAADSETGESRPQDSLDNTCRPTNGSTATTTTLAMDDGSKTNWIAVENLSVLNRLRHCGGMWNGTVPIVELGSDALDGTVYSFRPSTGGAILNYYAGIDADIFVGTEVSSFSHDLLAARFFRGRRDAGDNYRYLPTGLEEWVTPDMADPPGHLC
jgi:hypothetical protein